MELSMPLVISFNIIKSFYSFRSSRGAPAQDDERCREGFTLLSVSLCQQSCLLSLLSGAKPGHLTASDLFLSASKHVEKCVGTALTDCKGTLMPSAGETDDISGKYSLHTTHKKEKSPFLFFSV